jgi:hypothetical protein
MRLRTGVVLCLLAVLGMAGCSGGKNNHGVTMPKGTASANTQGRDSDQAAALGFAQCMRDNGVPKYPDPDANGASNVNFDKLGVSREKFDEAEKKCKGGQGVGGAPPGKVDPSRVAQARDYAKCMRENGVPKYPDPDANGRVDLDSSKLGVDPNGPVMKAAEDKCQKYLGGGGSNERGTDSGGNG